MGNGVIVGVVGVFMILFVCIVLIEDLVVLGDWVVEYYYMEIIYI